MPTKILMRRGLKADLPSLDAGEYGVTTDTNEVYVGSSNGNLLITTPSGAMMDYAGATAPSGWLMCDGAAVSRTTYANLFAAIGTSYGVGNGSTTFNLPDFRGRFARYNDDMGTAQNPAFVDKTSKTAGSFIVGRKYKITALGTTNFTLIGASANTVGVIFTATGVGSGTGTADESRERFSAQSQSTAKNGLTNSSSSVSVSGTTGGSKSVGSTIEVTTAGDAGQNWSSHVPRRGTQVTGFSGDVGYPGIGHTHDFSASGTASAQTINDPANAETRPVNLACNRIIKI
jgi:microcystin-dependent protein